VELEEAALGLVVSRNVLMWNHDNSCQYRCAG